MNAVNLYWIVLPCVLYALAKAARSHSVWLIGGALLLFLFDLFCAVVVSLGDLGRL